MKKTAKIKTKMNETRVQSVGLTPLGDRIVVKAIKAEDGKKTESGIYIPDSVKEDKGTKRGKVVAVGPGKHDDGKLIPMSIKVGDSILFQWGEEVSYNGEEYFVVREAEVLAIIN